MGLTLIIHGSVCMSTISNITSKNGSQRLVLSNTGSQCFLSFNNYANETVILRDHCQQMNDAKIVTGIATVSVRVETILITTRGEDRLRICIDEVEFRVAEYR